MNDNERAVREWEQALERLTLDVTLTAYVLALRYEADGSWLDLELGLWKALARTVRDWGRRPLGSRAEGLPSSGGGNDRPHGGTILH